MRTMHLFASISGRLRRILPISDRLWTKFDLLRTLVRRDLEARYKGSVLGNLWSIVNPLSQLLIYTYVFSVILKVKLSLKGLPANENVSFGLWLFAGLLPWIAFSTGLNQSASSVIGQPNLVKKVVFPLSLLPLVPILSAFVESSFGLMMLIFFVALSSGTIHTTLALLPLVWLPQLLLTAGLGYLAAGLTVFLRDIPQTLNVILNIWFYATPVVYPAYINSRKLAKLDIMVESTGGDCRDLPRLCFSGGGEALGRVGSSFYYIGNCVYLRLFSIQKITSCVC